MEILIVISTPQSAGIARGLAEAALRAGLGWGVFLTNDGVRVLSDRTVADTLVKATSAIVCKESWKKHMGDAECPVELGSQTHNSELAGEANHIISL